MKALVYILLISLVFTASQADARRNIKEPFNINTLKVNIDNIDGMLVADFHGNESQDVLLIGRDNQTNKQLQLITLDQGQAAKEQIPQVSLPASVLFYSPAKLAGKAKESLLLLEPGKINLFNTETQKLELLVEAKSLYRDTRRRTSFINQLDFVFDVNGDGLSDLILPDFRHTRIYVQRPDGTFDAPQVINMMAEMRLFRNNSAVYLSSPLFIADFNFDGEKDFIYRAKDQLHVFLQKEGKLAPNAQVLPLTLAEPLSDEYDNFESDHSNMVTHSFFRLVDLNNDKVLDLITKLTRSSGLLDKDSQYQIYFGGKNEQGYVGFAKEPDSVIASQGLQFELKLWDFDGDKKFDLVSPSYDLGVGAIIASLFSSSADLDIHFHKLNGSGVYSRKANHEKELTVDFNLSSGQNVYPLLNVNDFNGDGINDLLIGNGTQKIYLYPGEQSDKLFSNRAKKYRIDLPRDARLIDSADLNNDGKTDLLIRYGKLDGKSNHNQMRILLAQ